MASWNGGERKNSSSADSFLARARNSVVDALYSSKSVRNTRRRNRRSSLSARGSIAASCALQRRGQLGQRRHRGSRLHARGELADRRACARWPAAPPDAASRGEHPIAAGGSCRRRRRARSSRTRRRWRAATWRAAAPLRRSATCRAGARGRARRRRAAALDVDRARRRRRGARRRDRAGSRRAPAVGGRPRRRWNMARCAQSSSRPQPERSADAREVVEDVHLADVEGAGRIFGQTGASSVAASMRAIDSAQRVGGVGRQDRRQQHLVAAIARAEMPQAGVAAQPGGADRARGVGGGAQPVVVGVGGILEVHDRGSDRWSARPAAAQRRT